MRLSRAALAELCECNSATIEWVESGKRSVSLAMFIKMCRGLSEDPVHVLHLILNIEDKNAAQVFHREGQRKLPL